MQQVYRFGSTPQQPTRHLFVFLHASGADARSMIPAAFKYQGRFPSAALVVPSGFARYGKENERQQWFSTQGLTDDNRMDRISAILPKIEQLVRREQTNHRVPRERTVLIGYSQGGTVALEAVKAMPELAGAVVAYSARFARLPQAVPAWTRASTSCTAAMTPSSRASTPSAPRAPSPASTSP